MTESLDFSFFPTRTFSAPAPHSVFALTCFKIFFLPIDTVATRNPETVVFGTFQESFVYCLLSAAALSPVKWRTVGV